MLTVNGDRDGMGACPGAPRHGRGRNHPHPQPGRLESASYPATANISRWCPWRAQPNRQPRTPFLALGPQPAPGTSPAACPWRSPPHYWLALTLVIGLVLFCGVALFLNDTNLRSVLIGGLTASAGTAIAFYFSSKSADQARQDILKVTFGTETVPDLEGCTREKALGQLGQTSLQLVVDPASSTAADATVVSQIPLKDSQVLKGSQVVVKLDSAAPAAVGD